MGELGYKDLQVKAKELGMEKVVGVSTEELKKYIVEHQSTNGINNAEGQTSDLLNGESSGHTIDSNNEENNSSKDDVSNENENNLNKEADNRVVEQIVVTESEIKPVLLETDITKEVCIYHKDDIAQTRGFKDYYHAKNYIVSDDFKKLSIPDQKELKKWFESI